MLPHNPWARHFSHHVFDAAQMDHQQNVTVRQVPCARHRRPASVCGAELCVDLVRAATERGTNNNLLLPL